MNKFIYTILIQSISVSIYIQAYTLFGTSIDGLILPKTISHRSLKVTITLLKFVRLKCEPVFMTFSWENTPQQNPRQVLRPLRFPFLNS